MGPRNPGQCATNRLRVALCFSICLIIAISVLVGIWHFRFSSETNVALAKTSGDPHLYAWIKKWQRSSQFGKAASPESRSALEKILKGTDLSAQALIDTGREIHITSGDDVTTALIYAAGVRQGHKELAKNAASGAQVRPLLFALDSTRGVFWKVIDSGHLELVDDAYVLCTDLARWIPPGDPDLESGRQHGKIGAAGCLYLKGQIQDALVAIEHIDKQKLKDNERLGVEWIHSLALFDSGRLLDALPKFREIAEHSHFHHSKDALPFLALALARTGDADGANEAFDDWIRRSHPGVKEAAALLRTIRKGASNEKPIPVAQKG